MVSSRKVVVSRLLITGSDVLTDCSRPKNDSVVALNLVLQPKRGERQLCVGSCRSSAALVEVS